MILVFHEYGEIKEGPTIHSKMQMGCAGCSVGDLPLEMGGTQSITTTTRYGEVNIPITFKNGLPFIEMEYPSEDDLSELRWIEMTQSTLWDPSIYDGKRPTSASKEVPKVMVKSRNETVVLNIKRRTETVFTDCDWMDMEMWKEWRNQSSGETTMNKGDDIVD